MIARVRVPRGALLDRVPVHATSVRRYGRVAHRVVHPYISQLSPKLTSCVEHISFGASGHYGAIGEENVWVDDSSCLSAAGRPNDE